MAVFEEKNGVPKVAGYPRGRSNAPVRPGPLALERGISSNSPIVRSLGHLRAIVRYGLRDEQKVRAAMIDIDTLVFGGGTKPGRRLTEYLLNALEGK